MYPYKILNAATLLRFSSCIDALRYNICQGVADRLYPEKRASLSAASEQDAILMHL
jgi:hypothetical protein